MKFRSWFVFLFACIILTGFLGSRGLNEPDEGRFSAIAGEMVRTGDWLMPHLNGIEHLQKPPLVYWSIGAFIELFGRNEWAVRATTGLAAIGTTALTMWMAGILFGASARWMSGLILVSSGLFFGIARLITTDMLLTFWITASVALLLAHVHQRWRWAGIGFFVAMGVGFLTKGPIALMIPMLAAVVWRIGRRRSGQPFPPLGWWYGVPLTLAIGLSWFVVLIRHHPSLLNYFYEYEFVDRIASDVHNRYQPFWYYGYILGAGLLPWSFFLPGVLSKSWARLRVGDERAWLFAGWVVAPLAVLCMVNSKLPTYMLPLFPPLAMVIAAWTASPASPVYRRVVTGCVAVLIGLGFLLLPVWRSLVEQSYSTTIPLPVAFWIGVALVVVAFAGLFLMVLRNDPWPRLMAVMGATVGFALMLLSSQAESFMQAGNSPVRALAREIAVRSAAFPEPPDVMAIGLRAHGLEFYLNRSIMRTARSSDVVLPMTESQRARILVDEDADAYALSRASDPVFLVMKKSRFRKNDAYTDWKVIAEAGTSLLAVSPGFPD